MTGRRQIKTKIGTGFDILNRRLYNTMGKASYTVPLKRPSDNKNIYLGLG
jgi:hypothetical protein